MNQTFIQGKKFNRIDYSKKLKIKGEYENCAFSDCIFSNVDLSKTSFADCSFRNCDFSMAIFSDTTLRDTKFKDCKMIGLHFEDCNKILFSPVFQGCQLNFSSFFKMSLKNVIIGDCILQEVDFTEADLSGLTFEHCDFEGAIFEHTVLEKVDLRTSINYSIDPELNRIHKAKFSKEGVLGLLDKYDIDIF